MSGFPTFLALIVLTLAHQKTTHLVCIEILDEKRATFSRNPFYNTWWAVRVSESALGSIYAKHNMLETSSFNP